MIGLSLAITQQRVSSLFSPSALFSAGEQGAWYDPSDISTLWQDSARTIPVTTDGDLVGAMDDKSGNGNHALQPTSFKRPTYRSSGGLYWLEFDGSNDSLKAGSVDLTSGDKLSVFIGTRRDTNPGAAAVMLELTTDWGVNSGTFISTIDPSGNVDFGSRGTTSVQVADGTVATPPVSYVLTGLADISAPSNKLRLNGAQVNSSTASQGTGNYGNHDLYIGIRADVSFPYDGRIYGLIVRGATSSIDEIDQAEPYLSGKSGVTL